MRRAFHVMAKPTSFQCNLKCDYCFYLEKEHSVVPVGKKPLRHMADDVLRNFIKQYIALSPGEEVDFAWQGGEPTLAGIDFYRKVIDYQQRYAGGKRIYNSMQTNGVLIDERWALFLAENQFLIGISVDGPAWLHDKYRKSNAGRSVFDQVIKAIGLFNQYGVDYNVLTVVNDETARAPLEIYSFLTGELGARYLQFIPVVEQRSDSGELVAPQAAGEKQLTAWSVSGREYGIFMTTIFSSWVRNDVGKVYVQLFDNALAAWSGDMPSLCVMQPTCGYGLVTEQNGDIYSCDHYVYPEYRLGNVLTHSLKKMATSKQQQRFGQQKANVSSLCQQCEYRFVCHGGCPKHRTQRVGTHWHNHLCEGYKAIFSYMKPYMEFMANELRYQRPPANIMAYADRFQPAHSVPDRIMIKAV